ncbi:hypothetical protein N8D56_00405 [Devosia sp. A8/3-2]|nr:hypothetical protein N8D56_00405 [Devosia sp. A8/3-2]
MKIDLMKSLLVATTAFIVLSAPAHAQGVKADYVPVTDEMLANPPAEDWLMFRGAYNNQGYSPLDLINKDTVGPAAARSGTADGRSRHSGNRSARA